MKPHLQEYIDEFNSGEFEDLLGFFGSMEQILKFFHKQNLLQYIDPFDDNLSDYQLEILDYLLNVLNDRETLKYCIAQLNDIESIVIVSDSEYSLNCISKYSKNWFDSDMNVIDDTKKNIDIFRLIHIVKNKIKKNIEYVKVKSHSNNLDVLSYYNDKVDKLAQNAC